jgi:hypothetical protein
MSTLRLITHGHIKQYQLDKRLSFEEIENRLSQAKPDAIKVLLFRLDKGGTLIISREVLSNSVIEIYNED